MKRPNPDGDVPSLVPLPNNGDAIRTRRKRLDLTIRSFDGEELKVLDKT